MLVEKEGEFRGEFAQQQDFRFDFALGQAQCHGNGGADSVAVGANVRGHQHAVGAGENVEKRFAGVSHGRLLEYEPLIR